MGYIRAAHPLYQTLVLVLLVLLCYSNYVETGYTQVPGSMRKWVWSMRERDCVMLGIGDSDNTTLKECRRSTDSRQVAG